MVLEPHKPNQCTSWGPGLGRSPGSHTSLQGAIGAVPEVSLEKAVSRPWGPQEAREEEGASLLSGWRRRQCRGWQGLKKPKPSRCSLESEAQVAAPVAPRAVPCARGRGHRAPLCSVHTRAVETHRRGPEVAAFQLRELGQAAQALGGSVSSSVMLTLSDQGSQSQVRGGDKAQRFE